MISIEKKKKMQQLVTAGILLILVGVIMFIAGLTLSVLEQGKGKTEVKGGAIIFIGPIPIALGTDKNSIIIISILMIILMIIAYFLFRP